MPDGSDDKAKAGAADDKAADAEFWKNEAKKAFQARDEVKERMRTLEGRALSEEQRQEYDRLRQEHASLEEQRKRAEGQFDTLRQELVTKHQTELKAAQEKLTEAQKALEERELQAAFLSAGDWFGPTGKTILPAEVALDHLRRYCGVENGRVVVRDLKGKVIRGADGDPAPFSEAIGELLTQLPTREALLRGSGKAGSGSTGGAAGLEHLDLNTLITRAREGDQRALQQLRQRQARTGGIVQGAAFDLPAAGRS